MEIMTKREFLIYLRSYLPPDKNILSTNTQAYYMYSLAPYSSHLIYLCKVCYHHVMIEYPNLGYSIKKDIHPQYCELCIRPTLEFIHHSGRRSWLHMKAGLLKNTI